MSKVRVMVAEMEGSEEAVLAAIRTALGVATPPIVREEIAAPAAAAPVRALTAPVAEPPAAVPQTPRPARGGRRSPASAPSVAAAESGSVGAEAGCVGAVIEALRKYGPLASAEVVKKSGYSDGGVYAVLKRLRGEGRVEMVEDERDGLRKNKLVERGSGEGKRS